MESSHLKETMSKKLVYATIMNAIIQNCLPDLISKYPSDNMRLKVAIKAIQKDFLQIYRASKTLKKKQNNSATEGNKDLLSILEYIKDNQQRNNFFAENMIDISLATTNVRKILLKCYMDIFTRDKKLLQY